MPAIPLKKYIEIEYPMTPKSTYEYWATLAFYHNKGPLAGMVKRVSGRWYVTLSRDEVVSNIINSVKELVTNG
jgi:hypothetical protein